MARIKTSTPLKASSKDFLLRDANLVSVSCDRYLPSDAAPRGKLATEADLEVHPGVRRERKGLIALITLGVKGENAAESMKERVTAFSIKIILEGFFELENQEMNVLEGSVDDGLIHALMYQLMPIASLKVRDLASGMGYMNIRQPIGFNTTRFEVAAVTTKPTRSTRSRVNSVAKK